MKRRQRTPLYKRVVGQIRQMIRDGRLGPGDQLLPERQLAEALGVSRPALREALTALTSLGLIEVRPGGGAYVRKASLDSLVEPLAAIMMTGEEDVFHLLEVRRILESQGARLATARASSRDLLRLRENALIAERDMSKGFADESDTEFHQSIVQAAHNPVLIEVMSMLSGLMREAYGPTRAKLLADPDKARIYAEQHYRIYLAIKAKDALAAEKAVCEHLDTVQGEMKRIYEFRSV
ncbi:MAG: FadR family transcriptional regulator [Firmicutes bacterium]|nr:FadR family transcriptional regulator [Bacillota bacterium]